MRKILIYIAILLQGITICTVMFALIKWIVVLNNLDAWFQWLLYIGTGLLTRYPTDWLYSEYKKFK